MSLISFERGGGEALVCTALVTNMRLLVEERGPIVCFNCTSVLNNSDIAKRPKALVRFVRLEGP